MRAAKTQFNQHVELQITFDQQANYRPPKGINVLFYDRKNTEKAANRVNASFFATSINNELNAQKYLHDINAELALIGGYVTKDHLRKSDEPQLIRDPKVKSESILDPAVIKEDSIISRAREKHRINLTKEQVTKLKLKDAKRNKKEDDSYFVDFGKITQDH